ncbi:hypothetical protein N7519_006132 [Penicillium mononematosum]|uniref:uncharacterized protein n=1 Tax=Penicillium mononematosum TaxID=268346 RepID=UPI00254885D2|nr:uncharacterized protein N7519_006132 [Penicillium mononematosum]KAJ6184831.1 hypothetical protein N7519_006132 [Penicillium mononematosum]
MLVKTSRLFTLLSAVANLVLASSKTHNKPENNGLQDLLTWDQHSIIVRGERLMIFSGEFHPFRLPVPGLRLDVFQKIKGMGFTGVSFYVDWSLAEGNPGHVITDGIWSAPSWNSFAPLGANPSVRPTYSFPYDWQGRTNCKVQRLPSLLLSSRGVCRGMVPLVNKEGTKIILGEGVQDMCDQLVNEEAVTVVYKNNYSFGVKIFNIYMTFGGTNCGNLGYMGGHTSYDYGAAITEERAIWRGKYTSPAYLTATPHLEANGTYGAPSIAVTALLGNGTSTKFYLIKTCGLHYTLILPTSMGAIKIPQLGGHLTLNGRDFKFHVTGYDVGGINLIYSAEIFTWARQPGSTRVLILYGGAGETHEFGMPSHLGKPTIIEGDDIEIKQHASAWIVKWHVTPARRIVRVEDLQVYLFWRNDVYNYWVAELPVLGPIGNYSSASKDVVIVKAGYLIRTADLINNQLRLTGECHDGNRGYLHFSYEAEGINFNGEVLHTSTASNGNLRGTVRYNPPKLDIPDLSNLERKFIDSLPGIQASYDDSAWTPCVTELNTQSSAAGYSE